MALTPEIKAQLNQYLVNLKSNVVIEAFVDESESSTNMSELLIELAEMSEKITLNVHKDKNERTPSFKINRPNESTGIQFAGIPLGHEFSSLVLALLQVGDHPLKISDNLIEQIKKIEGNFVFETFISLSCHNCPDVVQALNILSLLNPRISHCMIDGALFQDEVKRKQIMSVPTVFLNGEEFSQGRVELEEIINKIDSKSVDIQADQISQKELFDILIIGGGPAGASAAVYSARKGIRTGIIAERFGGQVMDTLGIENFISVQKTEGPKLVRALEEHVKEYDVDVINLQKAKKIKKINNLLFEIHLESGGILKSKSVIIATGASWKELGVPGEKEFKGRGVAYCPHCDGPLFKGKDVAVVGGGNSGIEAAIDLAGIVKHVTILEYSSELNGDQILIDRLNSLDNIKIVLNAETQKIDGEGKVNYLTYRDRKSDKEERLDIEAVFIQIGLISNSEWLKDDIKLSQYGEIEINDHGETSMPGVFAAGDVTTIPYKQIIIAMGEGSKAALGAFDYLIRH